MNNSSRDKKPSSNNNSEEGFALPQILILSIALGVGITSLLASSIFRLTSSRINTLEINSRNASYSAISNLRALLNNSKQIYYYFWLAKACSGNATNITKECPSFNPIKDRHILEVGPGTGNLTSFILKKAPRKLIVVENDNYLATNLSAIDMRIYDLEKDVKSLTSSFE